MVDLVAEPGVADLIGSEKVVEAVRTSIRHDDSVKSDGEPSFPKALNGFCFANQTGACRNHYLLPGVRVDRICYETIHRCRRPTLQSVRQHGVDQSAFGQTMKRACRTNRTRGRAGRRPGGCRLGIDNRTSATAPVFRHRYAVD